MQPTRAQWTAYNDIFDYFNQELFAGELPGVILNFSRRSKTRGFFAPNRWEGEEGTRHEISLNPTSFVRTPKLYLSTLVHEMVHLWQEHNGIAPRRAYHDKKWAEKMKQVGLIPSDTGRPGGKETGASMTHYIEEGGAYDKAFNKMPDRLSLPFTTQEGIGIETAYPTSGSDTDQGQATKAVPTSAKGKSKNQYKSKYSCPGCGINVWGKAGLNINCNDCDESLTINDGQ